MLVSLLWIPLSSISFFLCSHPSNLRMLCLVVLRLLLFVVVAMELRDTRSTWVEWTMSHEIVGHCQRSETILATSTAPQPRMHSRKSVNRILRNRFQRTTKKILESTVHQIVEILKIQALGRSSFLRPVPSAIQSDTSVWGGRR